MGMKSVEIRMEVAHKKEINVGEDIVTWANLVVQEVYVVQMASALILVEAVVVLTPAQEGGWACMDVNILSQGLIVPVNLKGPIGLERNALALVPNKI
jgi:hypothetical protein